MDTTLARQRKLISLREARTILACADSGKMSTEQIAEIVGRSKKSVQNFVWRVRANRHPNFTVAMLLEPSFDLKAHDEPHAQPKAQLQPQLQFEIQDQDQFKPSLQSKQQASAEDVVKLLEQKANNMRVELAVLDTMVRNLRAELKL